MMEKAKSKRSDKFIMEVPKGISPNDAEEIYNQGWGHALASCIHWMINHREEPFLKEDRDMLVSYMNKNLKKSKYRRVDNSLP